MGRGSASSRATRAGRSTWGRREPCGSGCGSDIKARKLAALPAVIARRGVTKPSPAIVTENEGRRLRRAARKEDSSSRPFASTLLVIKLQLAPLSLLVHVNRSEEHQF